jgi:hypothetical protein
VLSSEADVTSSVVGIEYYSMKQNCITVSIELVYSECVLLPSNPEKSAGFEAVTHTTHVASSGKDQPAADEPQRVVWARDRRNSHRPCLRIGLGR